MQRPDKLSGLCALMHLLNTSYIPEIHQQSPLDPCPERHGRQWTTEARPGQAYFHNAVIRDPHTLHVTPVDLEKGTNLVEGAIDLFDGWYHDAAEFPRSISTFGAWIPSTF